jgi:tetratricopeptide (TPR) repeat protein
MTLSRETRKRVEYALGYIGLGMFEAARDELGEIPKPEQAAAIVQSVRVDLHLAAKQWKKAVSVARGLASDHPEVENAWIGWAYALRELNLINEAREVLLKAEPLHGKTSAVLHYNLACYDSLLGALKSAQARLKRAVRMDEQFKLAATEDPDLVALRVAGLVE